MKTHMPTVSDTDQRLLTLLHETSPQTMDRLASLPGMTWSQVFLAVDRLSRSGEIFIRPTGRRDYKVSIKGAVA